MSLRVRSGRVWLWLALLLGGGLSVAASVGHAQVRSTLVGEEAGPDGWVTGWAVVVAVLAPLMLVVVVKAFTAVSWPDGRRWRVLRWGTLLPVAGLAGYLSWSHTAGLFRSMGYDWAVCVLAWLTVNALIVAGVAGLVATRTTTVGSPARPPVNGNGTTRRGGPDAGLGLFEPVGRPRGGV